MKTISILNPQENVYILLNWGKVGSKTPDKTQKALAQTLANAGADLIITYWAREVATWLRE